MRYLKSASREFRHARTWTERLYFLSPLLQGALKDLAGAVGVARARSRRSAARMSKTISDQIVAGRDVLGTDPQMPVRAGPFEGMTYENFAAGSVFGAKVLGTYEDEIAPWFEAAAGAGYQRFVDVGCAEGYYAVGMAKRCPDLEVFAFDVSEDAQTMAKRLAEINGLSDRVKVDGLCTPERLQELASGARTLLLSDIEGFEEFLLDPEAVPALRDTDMIVETHEHTMPGVTLRLLGRFVDTHRVDAVAAVPNHWKMRNVTDPRLAATAGEGRRLPQLWLRMTSLSQAG